MRRSSELFPYQREAAHVLANRRRCALLLEPGMGKTAITLSALMENRPFPALVVAPASVVRSVWPREAAAWEHTCGIRVVPIVGSPVKRRALLLQQTPAHVEVISYDLFRWLTEQVPAHRYKAIVFDELSKMKHPGSLRFKAMKAWSANIPTRYGLTGTPVGNHLLDLWGEMYAVAGESPLGKSFTGYRSRFFYPTATVHNIPVGWVPFSGSERNIMEAIRPFTYVLPPQQEVRIPPLKVNRVEVEMPDAVAKQQKELVAKLRVQLESGKELVALQASTLATKLRQFASGAVYTEAFDKAIEECSWEEVHKAKLAALSDLIDELQGEPLLVFTWYRHEGERIVKAFPQAQRLTQATLDPWNKRKVEVLVAHPQSAGHGLNLQHGGHHVAWFTLPWSWELWRQANGRLARTGQPSPVVHAHVLECGEADRLVLRALTQKGRVEKTLMDGLTT